MTKLRVLNELRPASEGFAGIPQETRIVHSILSGAEGLDLTGLLNGNVFPVQNNSHRSDDQFYHLSRSVLNLAQEERATFFGEVKRRGTLYAATVRMKIANLMTARLRPLPLDLRLHGDFIWQYYFAKTLSPDWLGTIRNGKYATLSAPWSVMNAVGYVRPFRRQYLRIDTSAYDVMISQTPFPARISEGTQMVIRYHDAIPMFYPYTIHGARRHQFAHYYPLKSNLAQGAKVVCNSENSRNELLALFPDAENRAEVIPCAVSDAYRPEAPAAPDLLRDIVASNIEPDTAPKFRSPREAQMFYSSALGKEAPFRYLIMVSTIEPRKNHGRLIAAWNTLRHSGHPDLKLVIVGRPGWHVDKTLEAMRPFQERGLLFNISRVSSGDLRKLYRGAAAVVCPSVAEGFDLSGVEAMLSEGQVAASDIPVHREVYDDACTYFNPHSTSEAVEAIRQLLESDEGVRAGLRDKGARIGARYKVGAIAPRWADYIEQLRGAGGHIAPRQDRAPAA